ncbi:sigma-70 family RNA polymerase sigma factor [Cytobacillus praedii]|uniref:sigma-70 family RNA polymerase sigma factor n=1 Tax=Cytobacillus praedii TaxID=1742358 RepID=UPI002E1DB350|nr:sigma-70 family RNA polymerase sigma factor [Cytobacillus praedii]
MKCNENNYIQRLQHQKEDALEFIVDKYLPLMKGISQKILAPLKNEGIIEECINDIFLSIWNHAKKFHGDETDFRKWICSIAKFKAIDYYRRTTNKKEFARDIIVEHVEKSAEDELLLMEDKSDLIRLINQLEPVDRKIFIMKFFLGLRTEEISLRLGLTESSISNRIYRGKKKLHIKAANLDLGGNLV